MSEPISKRWTFEELKIAFGKIHARNEEIIKLAAILSRTPSSVSMKLANFASLDPAIRDSGRAGLANASALDKRVWDEFHENWESLSVESYETFQRLSTVSIDNQADLTQAKLQSFELDDFSGETKQVITQQRVKQYIFRKSVLSSYHERCCISGIDEPKFLIASHIIPWGIDKKNRLNPSNGLCLSVLHDRAFDKGFITVNSDFTLEVSTAMNKSRNDFLQRNIVAYQSKRIELPERFIPDSAFLAWHKANVFLC